jgi:hypothetical protein
MAHPAGYPGSGQGNQMAGIFFEDVIPGTAIEAGPYADAAPRLCA